MGAQPELLAPVISGLVVSGLGLLCVQDRFQIKAVERLTIAPPRPQSQDLWGECCAAVFDYQIAAAILVVMPMELTAGQEGIRQLLSVRLWPLPKTLMVLMRLPPLPLLGLRPANKLSKVLHEVSMRTLKSCASMLENYRLTIKN